MMTGVEAPDARQRFDALVWPHAATVLRTAQFLVRNAAEALREHLAQLPEVAQFDVSAIDGTFMRCVLTPRDGLDLRPVIWLLARVRSRPWIYPAVPAQTPVRSRCCLPSSRSSGFSGGSTDSDTARVSWTWTC